MPPEKVENILKYINNNDLGFTQYRVRDKQCETAVQCCVSVYRVRLQYLAQTCDLLLSLFSTPVKDNNEISEQPSQTPTNS